MNPQIAPTGQGEPRLDASNILLPSKPWDWNVQGPSTNTTSLAPGGWSYLSSTNTITVPAGATVGNYLIIVQMGPGSPGNNYFNYYFFDVICMAEAVTVGSPTWNAATNKWDYPVTVAIQGGTSPFTPSRPSTQTVSLAPGSSTTFASSTTDSGSCSASSSTPIGPAKIPPGPPVEGEGPSVDEDDDSDFVLIDYPITGNPTCPLTTNQMKAKPQTTGNVTSTSSSKKSKSSSTYVPKRSTGLIDTSDEALKGKLKIGVGL